MILPLRLNRRKQYPRIARPVLNGSQYFILSNGVGAIQIITEICPPFFHSGTKPWQQCFTFVYIPFQFFNFVVTYFPAVNQRPQHQSISYKNRYREESNTQQKFFSFVSHY